MYKKLFILLVIGFIASLVLIACSGETASGGTNSTTGGNQVQMNDSQFVQSSITIKKGESVTLVSTTFTPHIIANGTWVNGQQKAATENGAPVVKGVQIDGNSSKSIGPFNSAGTFQLYCTIHPGMNLTVVVK